MKNLFISSGFLLVLASCRFGNSNMSFKLNPDKDSVYRYQLIKTTEHYNKNFPEDSTNGLPARKSLDTFKLKFSLQYIAPFDSLLKYRLTFADFYKNKRLNVVFKGLVSNKSFFSKDPLALFDSLGYIINGRSVLVMINKKGVVKDIQGTDSLIEYIANTKDESEAQVRSLVSDYLSNNALKDALNRFLSSAPGFKVEEGDRWIRNITLVTKAPVKFSTIYEFQQQSGDTAYVSIQSIISAQQSEGDKPYMKGKEKGISIVSFKSAMPYLYETRSAAETHTTDSRYEYVSKEHFLVKRYY